MLHLRTLNILATCVGWVVFVVGSLVAFGWGMNEVGPYLPTWWKPALLLTMGAVLAYWLVYATLKEAEEANNRIDN